ncbi:uncharacterized protein LOC142341693 [Convolutriloba macropyga]|uniref:uncharacterized protein LOC142341693 n=1 Tax=Convolutriloba macropyga TaxID=536237 RepID=UPI003F52826C
MYLLTLILLLALLKSLKSELVSFIFQFLNGSSNELKQQYLQLKKDISDMIAISNSISAQDEFAKWARNDRSLRKAQEKMQQFEQQLIKNRTTSSFSVNIIVSAILYVTTLFLLVCNRSTAVIFLPNEETFWHPFQSIVSYPCTQTTAVSPWIFYACSCYGLATIKHKLTHG